MFLTADAVDRHLPTQEAESIQMLHDLLTSPEVCSTTIRLYYLQRFALAGTVHPYHANHRVADRITCIWKALPILQK